MSTRSSVSGSGARTGPARRWASTLVPASEIDPSILGTLFERGLDPDKRSQLGAHYTDREKRFCGMTGLGPRSMPIVWSGAGSSGR